MLNCKEDLSEINVYGKSFQVFKEKLGSKFDELFELKNEKDNELKI